MPSIPTTVTAASAFTSPQSRHAGRFSRIPPSPPGVSIAFSGLKQRTTPIPAGEHQVRMEFAYAGGGLGKGGKVTLYTDGKKVGEGNVDATLTNVFSADDGCDVGEDTGAPVSPDYGPRGNAFNGRVKGVQLAIAEAAEAVDHLVDPEEAVRVALARQ